MNKPAIRMKFGTELSINKKVLYALDNPRYIHFWWSESRRVLLIGAVAEETPLSFEIKDRYYETRSGFKLKKPLFLQAIMSVADWHENMICAVKGKFIPELGMVAFMLDDAKEIEIES